MRSYNDIFPLIGCFTILLITLAFLNVTAQMNNVTRGDPVKQSLFALGNITVNYSDPSNIKSVIRGLAGQWQTMVKRTKDMICGDILDYNIQLFAPHPGKEFVETFTTTTSNISDLHKKRTVKLSNLVTSVVLKFQEKPESLKKTYQDFRKFSVYNETPYINSSRRLSEDLMNAISRFSNAKDFENAQVILKNDEIIWKKRRLFNGNASTSCTFSIDDHHTLEFLARVPLPILEKTYPKTESRELLCAETLTYLQYGRVQGTEKKYQRCFVTLMFSVDAKILAFRRDIDKLWPKEKEVSVKYSMFCSTFSRLWEAREFQGVHSRIGDKLNDLCEPDDNDYTKFFKSINASPDMERVGRLILDWYYPGRKICTKGDSLLKDQKANNTTSASSKSRRDELS